MNSCHAFRSRSLLWYGIGGNGGDRPEVAVESRDAHPRHRSKRLDSRKRDDDQF